MNSCSQGEKRSGWTGPIAVVIAAHLALLMLPVEFSTAHTQEEAPSEISMVPAPELASGPESEPEVVDEPEPEPVEEAVDEPVEEPVEEVEPEDPVVAEEPETPREDADVAVADNAGVEEAPEEPVEEAEAVEERPLSDIEPFQDHEFEPDVPADWEPAEVPTPRRAASDGQSVDWSDYRDGVLGSVQSEEDYPRMASRRGWEGEATVRIIVDRQGRLADSPEVVDSSRHAMLDDEALRMVESAQPFEAFPDGADDDEREFVIPVRFQLEG